MTGLNVPTITVEPNSSGSEREDAYSDNLPPTQDLNDHNHIHPPNLNGRMGKRKSAEILNPDDFRQFQKRGSTGSFTEEARSFTKRASQMIIEVPVERIKQIKRTTGANSMAREIQHFVGITTLHGPLRMYRGKSYSRLFWGVMMFISLCLLVYQSISLLQMYTSRPTTSEVNFLISEDGMDFPMVTICNFNPIRKSYIKEINHTTGDFSENLLDYLIQYNYEVHNLFSNNDATLLDKGQAELNVYMQKHPNFTVMDFFRNGGFVCRNMLKICTFAGVEFDCCKYTAPIYTDLGKCFLINTTNLPDSSMHRQTAAGVNSGLQIILDAHLEEQFDGTGLEPQPIFTNALENGFRYYIHPSNTIPHVVSEGISVSPGANVYSALTVSNYELLDKNGWGNCTNTWPPGFNSNLPYASSTCASLCKARFFEEKCGCTPFVYNVDGYRKSCMPNETYTCIDQFGTKKENGRSIISLPRCAECQIECSTWNYASFNSYGQGFSNGAVKWIQLKNQADSNTHIRSNYVALNVFFRDMIYTKYIQQKGTSLTEILSDMGGNMGMWLGMSVLTFFEALIFLSKITWIFISKKRRMYMHEKKQQEQDKEKEMENTMSQLRSINKMDDNLDEETASTLDKLKRRIEQTLHHKPGRMNRITPIAPSFAMPERDRKKSRKVSLPHREAEDHEEHEQREHESEAQRHNFMESFYNNALYGDGRANPINEESDDEGGPARHMHREDNSVIQLKIDIEPIERVLQEEHEHSAPTTRKRTISIAPASCEYITREERARSRSVIDRRPSFYLQMTDE